MKADGILIIDSEKKELNQYANDKLNKTNILNIAFPNVELLNT